MQNDTKFATFFKFFENFSYFLSFSASGVRKCPLWFDNRAVRSFLVNNGLVFNILMSRNLTFLIIKFAIFSRFPKIFVNF